ncbi:nucleotide exchange factor GrpE [Nonomuraea sp. NPDC050153]|uniref:nucleotide exchange factor GrpE n=1 Tax=Nonomuraea sp. NPDC050153 TaxID=3364359 RepID=UPI003799E7FD
MAFERLVTDRPAETPDDALPGRSVAEVVTSIWRLDRRVRRLPGETRAVTRYLEMAWDALTRAGITIQEHSNDPFDPGLAIEVLSYQPAPGLDRDRVVETIRPSIYLNDQVIQRGEVIVGTPDPVAKEATP